MVGMVTYLGSAVVWAPVYALTLFLLKERFGSLIITVLKAELIVLVIIITLRYLTRRERPSPYTTKLPFTLWNRYSFPSHHAARMFLLTFVIGAQYQDSFPLMLSLAIVVALSRIFLAKHYLSDVLTGAAIGIVWGQVLT